MFFFPWVCLLLVASVRAESIGLTYASTCLPGVNGVVVIELGNSRAVPVHFTLVCRDGVHDVTVQPFSKASVPAVFFTTTNNTPDTCIFLPWTEDGTLYIYLVMAESAEIVMDDWIYCNTGTDPPEGVLQFESTCREDKNGHITVSLVNRADIPLHFYIECWNTWHEVVLDPGYVTSFPAKFYRGNRDYGRALYEGVEDDFCLFWPWTQDGTQSLFIVTQLNGHGYMNRFLYCKDDPPKKQPNVVYTSSCRPDHAGIVDVDLVNKDDDPVALQVLCSNDWYSIEIDPHSSATLTAVLSRGHTYDYIPHTCVFHIWDSHVDDQLIWIFTQGDGEEFKTNFLFCPARKEPAFRHSTTCTPDPFGLVPIRLENNHNVPLTFLLECLVYNYIYTVPPFSVITVTSVFSGRDNGTFPYDVCIFRPWTEDGVEGLHIVVKESAQIVKDNFIYCDTRVKSSETDVPYESSCLSDTSQAVISLQNSQNVSVTFTITCLRDTYVIELRPKSVYNFTAALYDGDRKYDVTNYGGKDREMCVFRPRLADGTQDVTVTTQEPGQNQLTYMVYCQFRSQRGPLLVEYESTCVPDADDILKITLFNNGETSADVTISCADKDYSFRLQGQSKETFPAVFYRGNNVFYPPETCVFEKHDALFGEDQFVQVFTENSNLAFKRERIFCTERKPFSLHKGSFRTKCTLDSAGFVRLQLVNEGEATLTFTIRCWDNDYQTTVSPRSRVTFLAVFFRELYSAYPDNTCVFHPRSNGVQSLLVAMVASPQVFTIEFLHCDIRSGEFQPLVHSESTCRSDEAGEILINLRNQLHVPVTFRVDCWYHQFEVNLEPHGAGALSVAHYAGAQKDYDACVFLPGTVTGWQAIQVVAHLPDGSSLPNYIYCKDSPPTNPPVVSYHSTCLPDDNGIITLHLYNNDKVPVWILLVCANEWINQTLGAGSTTTYPLLFNSGSETEYPLNACVLIDGTDFVLQHQYVWIFAEKSGGQYTSENFYCSQSSQGAKKTEPIVKLKPHCPDSTSGSARLELRADAPASGRARCKNGDKSLVQVDLVSYWIIGNFDQSYTGEDCLFYKKEGSETYTVDVEIGWGELETHVIHNQRIQTVSCVYDRHGKALSASNVVNDWFLNPLETQHLLGENLSRRLELQIIDALDRTMTGVHISLGKKIRLKAFDPTGTISSFKALSCVASNGLTSYPILRAGCGDGLVFQKTDGFSTVGHVVYSPFFETFKISGGNNLLFSCRFLECSTEKCDGNSCRTESRRRRSSEVEPTFVVDTRPYRLVDPS